MGEEGEGLEGADIEFDDVVNEEEAEEVAEEVGKEGAEKELEEGGEGEGEEETGGGRVVALIGAEGLLGKVVAN